VHNNPLKDWIESCVGERERERERDPSRFLPPLTHMKKDLFIPQRWRAVERQSEADDRSWPLLCQGMEETLCMSLASELTSHCSNCRENQKLWATSSWVGLSGRRCCTYFQLGKTLCDPNPRATMVLVRLFWDYEKLYWRSLNGSRSPLYFEIVHTHTHTHTYTQKPDEWQCGNLYLFIFDIWSIDMAIRFLESFIPRNPVQP